MPWFLILSHLLLLLLLLRWASLAALQPDDEPVHYTRQACRCNIDGSTDCVFPTAVDVTISGGGTTVSIVPVDNDDESLLGTLTGTINEQGRMLVSFRRLEGWVCQGSLTRKGSSGLEMTLQCQAGEQGSSTCSITYVTTTQPPPTGCSGEQRCVRKQFQIPNSPVILTCRTLVTLIATTANNQQCTIVYAAGEPCVTVSCSLLAPTCGPCEAPSSTGAIPGFRYVDTRAPAPVYALSSTQTTNVLLTKTSNTIPQCTALYIGQVVHSTTIREGGETACRVDTPGTSAAPLSLPLIPSFPCFPLVFSLLLVFFLCFSPKHSSLQVLFLENTFPVLCSESLPAAQQQRDTQQQHEGSVSGEENCALLALDVCQNCCQGC